MLLLKEELDQASLDKLAKLLGTTASDLTSFSQAIANQLGRELSQEKGRIISRAADLGRRKFLEKLGWLFNYEQELAIYAEILEVFALAKKQLIQQGLHQKSQQEWENLALKFEASLWGQKAQQKVSEYLAIEGQKIPANRTFIATSDLIESLFGKYKIFSSSSPCSEINEMILTLILSTIELTPERVLQAMETIQITDVNAWSQEVFGQSMLSKRKVAFSTPKKYIKVA